MWFSRRHCQERGTASAERGFYSAPVRLFSCLALIILLSGCSCLSGPPSISEYRFTVFRPREVIFYKPVGGIPPQGELVYVYLAIQNESRPNAPLCFADWNPSAQKWTWTPFQDLVPVVEASSVGAPLAAEPEVRPYGIAGEIVAPNERFPDIIPDPLDFPFNEANYRRDFAILLRPDRSQLDQSGYIDIAVSLGRRKGPHPDDQLAQIANFRLPVRFVDEFRPESMTAEPSEPAP